MQSVLTSRPVVPQAHLLLVPAGAQLHAVSLLQLLSALHLDLKVDSSHISRLAGPNHSSYSSLQTLFISCAFSDTLKIPFAIATVQASSVLYSGRSYP